MKKISCILLLFFFSCSAFVFAQSRSLDYTFHFESAQSELNENAVRAISLITEKAKQWDSHFIIIKGHTDNVGSPSSNMELSARRIAEVEALFVKAGINKNRIIKKAEGAAFPRVSNLYEGGRKQNRRVEIFLTEDKNVDYFKQQLTNKEAVKKLKTDCPVFFVRNSENEQFFKTAQNTHIRIPANAFDVSDNAAVQIKVTEAYKKSDMLLNTLITMSNGKQLISGGMLKVDAFVDDKPVSLNTGKQIEIIVPAHKTDERMQLFYSDESATEVNWIQPQKLAVNNIGSKTKVNNDYFYNLWKSGAEDSRIYYGERVKLPRQFNVIRSRPYLNKADRKPRDLSLGLEEPEQPQKVDSSTLQELIEVLSDHDAVLNDPCTSVVCKIKSIFRSKQRKSNIKTILLLQRNDIIADIKEERSLIGKQVAKQREFESDLMVYNTKKDSLHKRYLENLHNWDSDELNIDSVNYENAIFNHDLGYLYTHFKENEKIACQRLYAVDNFIAAYHQKKRENLVAYFNHFVPSDFNYNNFQIDSFIDLYSTDGQMDETFLNMAIQQVDTNYISWRKGEQALSDYLLLMYGVGTLSEVREVQKKARKESYKRFLSGKFAELGVDNIREAVKVHQRLIDQKKSWDSQTGYVFQTEKIGQWINCDYFSRFPQEEMITERIELPVSAYYATTCLVFEDFASIMNGKPEDENIHHYYLFENIPKNQQVKIVSYYQDAKGTTHVAVKSMKTRGDDTVKLQYKKMSSAAFKNVLCQVDG